MSADPTMASSSCLDDFAVLWVLLLLLLLLAAQPALLLLLLAACFDVAAENSCVSMLVNKFNIGPLVCGLARWLDAWRLPTAD
ncbi:hypothetical protein Mapa_008755 [Marchantia paleacea]|nr:hypothetical protein Mapa_008755 [Marchantia paleacea]